MRSLLFEDLSQVIHVVVRTDGRAACTITDKDYPTQSGISASIGLLKADPETLNLENEIKRLQDPAEADKFVFILFFKFLIYFFNFYIYFSSSFPQDFESST